MATKLPIVLAHGIARFDFLLNHFTKQLSLFGVDLDTPTDGINYFKGIARHLRAHHFKVEHSTVSFAAGVDRRAADLKGEVGRVLQIHGAQQVHIIAHSMGGLDARHMIVRHGMAGRVASLTTIGTPHKGTSFADWGIEHKGDKLIKSLSRVLDLAGFADLTTAACDQFNAQAEADEAENDVRYQTYASTEPLGQVFGLLQPSWLIINQLGQDDDSRENDGLVPRSSQQWTRALRRHDGTTKEVAQQAFLVPADHLNQLGWWDLNELRLHDLFHLHPVKAATDYELSVRNVYLKIANEL